jgi:iron complex outermembrane receptor protein
MSTSRIKMSGALRLLCALLCVFFIALPAAFAQDRSFDIDLPAQSLAASIVTLSQQTATRIVADGALISGVSAPRVSGRMTAEAALKNLLDGSSLVAERSGAGFVVKKAPPRSEADQQMPVVQIEGEAAAGSDESARGPDKGYVARRSMTGTKTNTPLIETPQSVSVITRDQLDAQGAQSLKQGLRYTAGVIPETRGAFGGFDILYSRGFNLDQYLDGTKNLGSASFLAPQLEPFGAERIEVLRGPSSVLYGQASPGGIVNIVSKRPTTEPMHAIELQAGNYDRVQGAFDLGGPIDEDGEFLYRLVGLAREGDMQTDFTEEKRVYVAPSLTWRPSVDTSLTLLAAYQDDPNAGLYNFVPSTGSITANPNGKISSSLFTGDPSFDKIERTQSSVGYAFEHRFSDTWSLRQNLRYMRTEGELNKVLPFFMVDDRTMARYTELSRDKLDAFTVDTQVQANFDTASLRHTLLFGVDYQRLVWDLKMAEDLAPDLDLFSPVYNLAIPAPTVLSVSTQQTQTQTGVYAQDQVKTGNWVFLAGVRQDSFESETEDRLAASTVSETDDAFSGRAGVVYLFANGLAPYASYAESFQPTSGTDFSGQAFKPTRGKQVEAGVKFQPPGSNAMVTLSAFNLKQQNVPTSDPAHPGFQAQTGGVRARGAELEGKSALGSNVTVVATYTYLDDVVTESNEGFQGNSPTGIPRELATLWGEYRAGGSFNGLGIGLGVRYTGSSFGDQENTLTVPSYTLVDAALFYDLARMDSALRGFRFALNVNNLLDKEFISGCTSSDYCVYGPRRSAMASVRYQW